LRWQDLRPPGSWSHLHVPAGRLLPTYNGRAALYQALQALQRHSGTRRRIVLVPAFHCPTVVDPVIDAGFEVRFYGLNERLEVDESDVRDQLDSAVAAVIFIRYFGISRSSLALRQDVRAGGAWIIDDCSHSFLQGNPLRLAYEDADATTYSFWKLLPSMTGGGVLFADAAVRGVAESQTAPSRRSSLQLARTLLVQLLDAPREAARKMLVQLHLRTPPTSEPAQPVVRRPASEAYPYTPEESRWRMPYLARAVIRVADLESIVAVRRRNFAMLAEGLMPHPELEPLWRTLDEHACPWGFPVRLTRRQERDYLIRDRGVPVFSFGEVLHPRLFETTAAGARRLEASRYLAESLLVLSVHQGLSAVQMQRTVRIVNEFFAAPRAATG